MAPRRKRILVRLVLDVVMERVRHYESDAIGGMPAEDVYEYEVVNRADLAHTIAQYMGANVDFNERIIGGKGVAGKGGVMIPFPEIYRKPKTTGSEG